MSNIGVVEKLQNFQYKDAKGKDWGLNVRNRAKELANFVLNPDRVRSERAKVHSFHTLSFFGMIALYFGTAHMLQQSTNVAYDVAHASDCCWISSRTAAVRLASRVCLGEYMPCRPSRTSPST